MSRGKFSYTVENQLSFLLVEHKRHRSSQLGKDVLLSDVEEELARFCELKRKSIMDIKRGINQPSLPVAMRIAHFFHLTVEDIFVLKTKEELLMKKTERIKELMKRLDSEILSELNGLLEEYLEDVEKHYPELTEEHSTYHLIRQFYMNLPASAYIDDTCDWLEELNVQIEAQKVK